MANYCYYRAINAHSPSLVLNEGHEGFRTEWLLDPVGEGWTT